jgi:hypothetical protein
MIAAESRITVLYVKGEKLKICLGLGWTNSGAKLRMQAKTSEAEVKAEK